MQLGSKTRFAIKALILSGVAVASGTIGAAVATHFHPSSLSISYVDFISIILTSLGVMLAIVTLFVAILAVMGWTSIEARLRSHSIEFIGSELKDDKPLAKMIKKAVREAVYEGVVPATDEDDDLPIEEVQEQ